MKKNIVIVAAAIAAVFVAQTVAALDMRTGGHAANLTRACIPAIGDVAITMAATTSVNADSGALNNHSLYLLQCDTDAFIRFGAAAVDAAADDWLQPANVILRVPTGGSEKMLHVSALSVSSNGDCRMIECK